VERALTLIATETLTISMARASKGKAVTLPWTLNISTGKESARQTGFSDATWGKVTCSYAKSASSFTNTKFDAIVQDARPFVNPKSTRSKTEAKEVIEIDDDDDERGNLVDNSDNDNDDDDEDCKLFLPFCDLINMIF
jgi:hypothetical protein